MLGRCRIASRAWVPLLASALLAVVSFPVSGHGATLRGKVLSGATPLRSLVVALYATDPDHPTRCASALGAASTGGDGSFLISYKPPADPDAVLYLVADAGSAAREMLPRLGTCQKFAGPVVLASVLGTAGPAQVPAEVVVNERTTVASAYALAQFIHGPRIGGKANGLQNAAAMVRNLANPATGDVGEALATPPNGDRTETRGSFNSLANMVAACVASTTACGTLFDRATPPRGPAPTDTLQAMVDIARHPAQSKASVEALFALSQMPPAPYQPARPSDSPPAAWTLALRFVGDGVTMDGPGNLAIDEAGSLWVSNNYRFSPDPDAVVCGSNLLLRFTPAGKYVPGSPYQGGGLDGAGYGITLDPKGDVWVGNFGFASPACKRPPPSDSVSQFGPEGMPLSPRGGHTQGAVDWPQGTVSDRKGNIWIASCGNGIVTKYPDGDPTAAENFVADPACGTKSECSRPFDIAFNLEGWAFVTLNGRNSVAILRPGRTPAHAAPVGSGLFDLPLGIAADSRGNMWVANSHSLRIPCPSGFLNPVGTRGSISMIQHDGEATKGPFRGGGLTMPWGIAVDGDDNVWVVNFDGQRLSQFCGREPRNCPPGAGTGSPISPDTGYAFDGFTRNTAVEIDRSGNVWVTNNWKNDPNPRGNPGGYEIVAFVGLAPPIATPLIGPPRRP